MKLSARPRWLRLQVKWNRRWTLWVLLVALVLTLLGALIWLAGRYEASLVQSRLERDTVEIATEQLAFGENAVGYSATLSFIRGRVETLTRALKGE